MKKQLLLILMTLLPMVAMADESGKCGDNLTWTYYESTHSLVIDGSGDMYSYYEINKVPWNKYKGNIVNLTLLEGVTSIGVGAFYKYSSLTSVTIPKSLTYIDGDSFFLCEGLTAVHISDLETWCKINFEDNPLYYAHHLYLNGEEVKDLVIPNSVTSISDNVFSGGSSLTSVTIPNGVTSIGNGAFAECSSLTSLTIPNGVTSVGNGAFSGCSGLTTITIPNSVTSIGNSAFHGCSSLTNVTIPNGVTSIEGGTFYQCSSLISINIPNGVTSIGGSAFYYCSSLTSVTIPNGVTSIGPRAFQNCKSLASVNIPNSVTSIGNEAFRECNSLTAVTIPNNITIIGDYTFYGCRYLSSMTIPNGVTSIGSNAFAGCIGLSSLTIPNSVTSIGKLAFYNCSNISSVYISDLSAWCKIKNVNETSPIIPSSHHLYLNGVDVEQLTIPNDITSLENYTFYGCSYITSINIPNSVSSIGEGAFSGCSRVTSLTLPDNLMIIKKQTFLNCSMLQKLIIPASVQYIYQQAFNGCNALTEIVAQPETPPFIYNDTFSNYNCTLKVPDAGKDAYLAHEIWSKFGTIQTLSGEDIEILKCATPTISYQNGRLVFSSATEGAVCKSTITDTDIASFTGNEVLLNATYNISVYATKTCYDNSDVATATLCWIDKEPVIDVTNVSQVPAQAVLIQNEGGVLTVQGLDDGQQVRVYGIDGTQAGAAVSSNGQATVGTNLKAGSVAIIKIGDKSVKVVVK